MKNAALTFLEEKYGIKYSELKLSSLIRLGSENIGDKINSLKKQVLKTAINNKKDDSSKNGHLPPPP